MPQKRGTLVVSVCVCVVCVVCVCAVFVIIRLLALFDFGRVVILFVSLNGMCV